MVKAVQTYFWQRPCAASLFLLPRFCSCQLATQQDNNLDLAEPYGRQVVVLSPCNSDQHFRIERQQNLLGLENHSEPDSLQMSRARHAHSARFLPWRVRSQTEPDFWRPKMSQSTKVRAFRWVFNCFSCLHLDRHASSSASHLSCSEGSPPPTVSTWQSRSGGCARAYTPKEVKHHSCLTQTHARTHIFQAPSCVDHSVRGSSTSESLRRSVIL